MRAANIWCFLQVPNYYILLLKAKGKEKKGVKTKKKIGCSTIQMMSIIFYQICDIKIYCEIHTA